LDHSTTITPAATAAAMPISSSNGLRFAGMRDITGWGRAATSVLTI